VTPVVVESVATTLVDLPLRRPHQFRDTSMDAQAVLLVRVRTRDGVVGLGEGVVPGGPWWGGESVETMQVIVQRYLAPLVVGANLTRLPALRARMDRMVAANPFAKCALETAMWDAWARSLDLPLHALLGGRCRDSLPVTWAIGAADPDLVLEEALAKVESGQHASIKLKMGALPPEADTARVEKVASSLAEVTSVRVDLNGAWDELTATRLLPHLEQAGIDLVEQPTPAVPAAGALMTGGPAVDMPTSTTFELPGYRVERTLGLSWGLIVRSVGLTKGLTGTVRSLKAGEVKEFTEVVDRARHTALERLIDHARQLGGNAVLGVRFDSSDLGNGLAEIVAYGTAATVRPA
jgi:uncharacterized protein YbjQ (UPF0145 family)